MKVICVTANPAIDLTVHAPNWKVGVVNRGTKMDKTPGGKGLSVAINLADAGISCTASGWIGSGNFGTFSEALKKHHIEDAFIKVEGETRRCIKIIEENSGDTTDINMPGLHISAQEQEQLLNYLDLEVDENTTLVLGGSLPPGVEKNFYADVVKKYRDRASFIVVDTSGEALVQTMKSDVLPHMIKPNIHELSELCGKDLDSDEEIVRQAKAFVNQGVALVVVSMGDRGAWFVDKEEAILAQPPRVKVVSTVGAGDAMVAGTVRGILLGHPLERLARTATAYSTANIQHMGTYLPDEATLDALKSRVVVSRLL